MQHLKVTLKAVTLNEAMPSQPLNHCWNWNLKKFIVLKTLQNTCIHWKTNMNLRQFTFSWFVISRAAFIRLEGHTNPMNAVLVLFIDWVMIKPYVSQGMLTLPKKESFVSRTARRPVKRPFYLVSQPTIKLMMSETTLRKFLLLGGYFSIALET